MKREQLFKLIEPFGFVVLVYEDSQLATITHPLCGNFCMSLWKDEPAPTLAEVINEFYLDARRDESDDHRCW